MQLIFTAAAGAASGAYIVGAVEGLGLLPSARKIDGLTNGALSKAIKTSGFKAKPATFLDILAPAGVSASRVIVVGLGKEELPTDARTELSTRRRCGSLLCGIRTG